MKNRGVRCSSGEAGRDEGAGGWHSLRPLMSIMGGKRTLVRVNGIHADPAAASKAGSVGRRLLRRRAIAEDVAGDAAEQRDHSLAGNDLQQTKQ